MDNSSVHMNQVLSVDTGNNDFFVPDSGEHDPDGNIIIPETQLSELNSFETESSESKKTPCQAPHSHMEEDLQFLGFAGDSFDYERNFPPTEEINSMMRTSKRRKAKSNSVAHKLTICLSSSLQVELKFSQ